MIATQNITLPNIAPPRSKPILQLLVVAGAFLCALLLGTAQSQAAAAPAPVYVSVEGKPLEMPVPPVIVEDRTLVGVRFVGEAVGGQVEWDPVARQVTVTRLTDKIVLTVGSKEALVNGQQLEMQVAAQIVSDRTMVPIRFIAEALGGTVEWNPDTRTVNILRKPAAIGGMLYSNEPGKSRVVLKLTEAPQQVKDAVAGNTLTLDIYPARIATDQTQRNPGDTLMKSLRLIDQGRTTRLEVQLQNPPAYRYFVSPDGTQLVLEFDYTIVGINYRQENRSAEMLLSATGKLNYTAFQLDGPPRLVIDVTGARLNSAVPASVDVNQGHVIRVRTADRGADGIRIVLDLTRHLPYQVLNTDLGLEIHFVPSIQAVKTERLPGKTRLTISASSAIDAVVSAPEGQRKLLIDVPQGISALAQNTIKLSDGTIDTITVLPGAARNSTSITIALPYYLGHTVISKNGDNSIVIDLVTSPVYGKRIWIDAGHGKIPGGNDDPGSIGKTYKTQEKQANLAVALELQHRLRDAGAVVLMTRTGDVGIDFRDRPALITAAKPAVDLMISIHHNSNTLNLIRGTETYYWTTNPRSKTAAQRIHPFVVKALGFGDRGVRQESFVVIKETKAPSILIELGYLSNALDEKAVAEPGVVKKTYPGKAAEAIKLGVIDYFWSITPR